MAATYTDGIRDAIATVERLGHQTGTVAVRIAASEIASLQPSVNKRRERTRADAAESVVMGFARRIVRAAFDDLEFAEQRPETSFGNVVASIQFTPIEVINWATYASKRGDQPAAELLQRIEQDRPPVMIGM